MVESAGLVPLLQDDSFGVAVLLSSLCGRRGRNGLHTPFFGTGSNPKAHVRLAVPHNQDGGNRGVGSGRCAASLTYVVDGPSCHDGSDVVLATRDEPPFTAYSQFIGEI